MGEELYNLDIDPSEMHNLAEEYQDIVKDLYVELLNFAAETGAEMEKIESN